MVNLWILSGVLFLLDLFLVVARTGLLNVRIPYLVTLREEHSEAVEQVIALLEKPRMRVSLHVWVVLVHFLLAMCGIWLFSLWTGRVPSMSGDAVWVVLAVIVLLAVEFGLEGLVLPRAELVSIRLAPWTRALDFLISPLSAILMLLLGSPNMLQTRMSAVTEDELKTWAQEGQAEGSLEPEKREMIYSIFQFGDTLAREILIPRIDVLALEVNTSVQEAIQTLTRSGYSRVPVYEGTIDHIIGLLYTKDLLRVTVEGQSLASLRNLLRPAYFVPESKKVDELLREMQSRSVHMALVVDEFGGIAGLVTLEDIVEEIVGEIRDEYDQSEEVLYEQVGPREYLFQGQIDLDDFNEIMGTHIPKDATDTLGGFVYSQIGRVPSGGEQIEVEELTLTVEQVSRRRIRKVRALSHAPTTQPEETEKEDETEQ